MTDEQKAEVLRRLEAMREMGEDLFRKVEGEALQKRWVDRQPAVERYNHDVAFRTLVDTLEYYVGNGDFTPSELREAVILAATKFAMRAPPSWIKHEAWAR